MSTESRILVEKSDHVALVTIDHPPVNALNLETAQQFEAVVNQLEADDEVRAVILTGAGEKSFSAGFDVSDAANGPAIGSLVRALWTRLDRFPKPLIAALNGHALGGGLELALCCHFRLAADRPGIKIGLTELNLGLIPGWGGTQRLARWVGHRTAVEMILLSQVLSPQEAQGAQLVNQVVSPDQLIAQAGELAGRLAAAGGEPRLLGLWPDDPARLKAAAERSLGDCDLTLVSGGSSVGSRDYTAGVFLSLPGARLLVHGVAVSPGKPFLWVQAGGHHFLGLPGQVASCLVAFHLLAEPLLERLQGRPAEPFARFPRLAATLSRPLPSAPGREEYVRVRVRAEGGDHLAEPVFGKSGLLTTLIKGHGLVRVPATREGFYAGDRVEVLLFPG